MNYYEEIKKELLNNEVKKAVKEYSKNKSDLNTYYNVGKLLIDAQSGEERAKYGNKLIEEYSKKLTIELGKGYSVTNLKYMRQFYLYQKSQQLVDLLPWGHYTILLSIKDENERNYYIDRCIKNHLSRDDLRRIKKEKEYERLSNETKTKLIENKELEILDEVKNPIIIRNSSNIDIDNIKEKILKELILDDISNFLKQLGNGYAFIDSEYKIKYGDTYNYIDLLLYNYVYKCFVVVELKVTELKKEHIGQVMVYMNYIDENLRNIGDNKTIGLIVVKENDEYIIRYSSDKRIKAIEYSMV